MTPQSFSATKTRNKTNVAWLCSWSVSSADMGYTHLYALTCGVVGCAERAAGVPFSVPGVGAAA